MAIKWTVKDVDERMQKAISGGKEVANSSKLLGQLVAKAQQGQTPKE